MTDEMVQHRIAALRKMIAGEIIGPGEVCDILKIQSGNLQHVAGLPDPVDELMRGKIWLRLEVEEFAKEFDERRASRRGKAAA